MNATQSMYILLGTKSKIFVNSYDKRNKKVCNLFMQNNKETLELDNSQDSRQSSNPSTLEQV